MNLDGPEQPVATVVAIDVSWSTALKDSFESIKSAAISLRDLIENQFPDDHIHFVTFAPYAASIESDQLPALSCDESVLGTNMHHALLLSREWLLERAEPKRQIIILTDGEATAHIERDRSYFAYPPSPITLQETSNAVRDCARSGMDVILFLTDPAAFAASALRWTLGGDHATLRRVEVIPSSPTDLSERAREYYVNVKLQSRLR